MPRKSRKSRRGHKALKKIKRTTKRRNSKKRMNKSNIYSYKYAEQKSGTMEYHFYKTGKKLSFIMGIAELYHQEAFRTYCSHVMQKVFNNNKHYYWAMTKIHNEKELDSKDFIFYFRECPELAYMKADPSAYEEYFKKEEKSEEFDKTGYNNWTFFGNLSKDTLLLVPLPDKADKADKADKTHRAFEKYKDIANFVRYNNIEKVKNMLLYIAVKIIDMTDIDYSFFKEDYGVDFKNKFFVVNTHGNGIPYLHIRFDTRDKYTHWMDG